VSQQLELSTPADRRQERTLVTEGLHHLASLRDQAPSFLEVALHCAQVCECPEQRHIAGAQIAAPAQELLATVDARRGRSRSDPDRLCKQPEGPSHLAIDTRTTSVAKHLLGRRLHPRRLSAVAGH
jgi:hypothetical protein